MPVAAEWQVELRHAPAELLARQAAAAGALGRGEGGASEPHRKGGVRAAQPMTKTPHSPGMETLFCVPAGANAGLHEMHEVCDRIFSGVCKDGRP